MDQYLKVSKNYTWKNFGWITNFLPCACVSIFFWIFYLCPVRVRRAADGSENGTNSEGPGVNQTVARKGTPTRAARRSEFVFHADHSEDISDDTYDHNETVMVKKQATARKRETRGFDPLAIGQTFSILQTVFLSFIHDENGHPRPQLVLQSPGKVFLREKPRSGTSRFGRDIDDNEVWDDGETGVVNECEKRLPIDPHNNLAAII